MQETEQLIETTRLLIFRLERLSADSYWAHRASGLRGSLLRSLDKLESESQRIEEIVHLRVLVEQGYQVLENGAREIRVPEE